MGKTIFQDKYPFVQITLPQREEIFVMQTENPQWVIQIIPFVNKEKFDTFIKEKCPGTYTPNEKHLLVSIAVSPLQEINITSENMKEENAIQEQAEIDALAWWISQQPEKKENPKIKKVSADLRIGQEIANWKNDAFIQGIYDEQINKLPNLPSGKAMIKLHTHGIRIMVDLKKYDIHHSQITNIEKTTSAEIIQSPRFAYGKAFVGGALFGPLGIFIGGNSSSRLRSDVNVNNFMIIDFIDPNTDKEKSLVIYCDERQAIDKFIKRQQKENYINESQNRVAGKDKMPISLTILFIFIFSVVLAIIGLFIYVFHLTT